MDFEQQRHLWYFKHIFSGHGKDNYSTLHIRFKSANTKYCELLSLHVLIACPNCSPSFIHCFYTSYSTVSVTPLHICTWHAKLYFPPPLLPHYFFTHLLITSIPTSVFRPLLALIVYWLLTTLQHLDSSVYSCILCYDWSASLASPHFTQTVHWLFTSSQHFIIHTVCCVISDSTSLPRQI